MVTLRNIIEGIDTLDNISDMTATVGPWTIKIWNYNGEREIKFTRDIPEQTEGVDDDLPFA